MSRDCARLNSLTEPRTNTFLTYSRLYSLPRDTISLQIKDNGGQVNTGCAETVSNSAALSHPRHTDVEISCKGSSKSHPPKEPIPPLGAVAPPSRLVFPRVQKRRCTLQKGRLPSSQATLASWKEEFCRCHHHTRTQPARASHFVS